MRARRAARGKSFFPELVDNREHGTKILFLRWWLWDFTGCKHELLLSDNPCMFTGSLNAPELIIALPLSPTKAFLASRGARTAANLRQQHPNVLAVLLNEESVRQSRARLYARTAAPARFIENRCSKFFGAAAAPTARSTSLSSRA
jgi:hypothetical protein